MLFVRHGPHSAKVPVIVGILDLLKDKSTPRRRPGDARGNFKIRDGYTLRWPLVIRAAMPGSRRRVRRSGR